MRDLVITRETYEFACRHCKHTWSQVYEARRMHHSLGEDLVEYLIDGVPVQAPVADLRCINCGCIGVHVAPQRDRTEVVRIEELHPSH